MIVSGGAMNPKEVDILHLSSTWLTVVLTPTVFHQFEDAYRLQQQKMHEYSNFSTQSSYNQVL